MIKNEAVNQGLRKYVKANLTPTEEERRLISSIYDAVCSILSDGKCLQIGSYPRYTAIRPPHDLDILFILGKWDKTEPKPFNALSALKQRLTAELTPPKGFSFTVELQTHSITIKFIRNGEEIFAVDIVPALITGANNEFGQDIYLVPEILGLGHRKRLKKYKRVKENIDRIDWILTDPRGYISAAAALNLLNKDFRKSVKFLKKWKSVSKERNNEFKLKSFHIEQIVTSYFHDDYALTILDALTKFFVELPSWLTGSQIPDRANSSKKIDDYIDELTLEQKSIILKSREEFLERLLSYEGEQAADTLFKEKSFAAGAGVATGAAMTSLEPRRVIPRSSFGD
jgi:hypothetical protein